MKKKIFAGILALAAVLAEPGVGDSPVVHTPVSGCLE